MNPIYDSSWQKWRRFVWICLHGLHAAWVPLMKRLGLPPWLSYCFKTFLWNVCSCLHGLRAVCVHLMKRLDLRPRPSYRFFTGLITNLHLCVFWICHLIFTKPIYVMDVLWCHASIIYIAYIQKLIYKLDLQLNIKDAMCKCLYTDHSIGYMAMGRCQRTQSITSCIITV